MNKLLKGSIAGAAGIALLLGGAGTLAYWNSEAGVTGGTISSGTLTITANGTAGAKFAPSGAALTSTSKIVPGDTVEVTQLVTISATGDNLKAALTIDTDALLSGTPNELESAVKAGITFKAYAGTTEVTGLSSLTPAVAATITKVVVTVPFPSTIGNAPQAGDYAQGDAITLGDVKVQLTQVP